MKHNAIKLFMLLSLLVPFKAVSFNQEELNEKYNILDLTRGKNKKFCSISARNACIDNLSVGALTLAGVSITNLTTLSTILSSGSPLVRSAVPFSSGLLTIASLPATTIPLTGLVMAFGNSTIVPVGIPTEVIPAETGFAFSVPEAGTLLNLRVSVDSSYAVALGAATPITYTFTVLQSHCVDGTVSAYAATALTASATTTTPTGTTFPLALLTQGVTGCGASVGSIAVAAGDRITILVTPSIAVLPAVVATTAFSAGLEFAPTL